MSVESPTNYSPAKCDGIYKDTFDEQFEQDFHSAPVGVLCKCSTKKTIFKKMSRFRRHCRGKIHQNYLSALLIAENKQLKELDINKLTDQLGNLNVDEKITSIEKSDNVSSDETVRLNMEEIARICKEQIINMEGDWVIPKNNYEKDFCALLDWECIPKGRYYDAKSEKSGAYIEIKKGIGGMWLDMIRYAEILLGTGTQDTITVYFNWNKKLERVKQIFVIDTKVLISALGLTKVTAKNILVMNETFPGRVNHLQCMTQTKIKNIAKHIILHPRHKSVNRLV